MQLKEASISPKMGRNTHRTKSTSHSSSHSAAAARENSSQFGFVTLERIFLRGEKPDEAMADPKAKTNCGLFKIY